MRSLKRNWWVWIKFIKAGHQASYWSWKQRVGVICYACKNLLKNKQEWGVFCWTVTIIKKEQRDKKMKTHSWSILNIDWTWKQKKRRIDSWKNEMISKIRGRTFLWSLENVAMQKCNIRKQKVKRCLIWKKKRTRQLKCSCKGRGNDLNFRWVKMNWWR